LKSGILTLTVKLKQKHKKASGLGIRRHIKHALIPHKGNHYRPHLMRLHGITAVLVIAALMQVGYGFMTSGRLQVLGRVSSVNVSDLLTDTNKAREDQSLPDLTLNDQLDKAAFLKAKDMFANNYWAHVSPSGVTPWKWLGDVGYNYDVAGENLAKNYPTGQATVDAWMASPTHRANILNPKYQDVGFAAVEGMLDGRDTTLVVAFYGRPASEAVQGASDQHTVTAAPVSGGIGNPLTYFGTALQSLSPATLGALAMLAVVGLVALAAHFYRKKLPVAWRRTWRLHHGAYTAVGVFVLGIVMIVATGGGPF
jgi:uncharacterized protein YkwD